MASLAETLLGLLESWEQGDSDALELLETCGGYMDDCDGLTQLLSRFAVASTSAPSNAGKVLAAVLVKVLSGPEAQAALASTAENVLEDVSKAAEAALGRYLTYMAGAAKLRASLTYAFPFDVALAAAHHCQVLCIVAQARHPDKLAQKSLALLRSSLLTQIRDLAVSEPLTPGSSDEALAFAFVTLVTRRRAAKLCRWLADCSGLWEAELNQAAQEGLADLDEALLTPPDWPTVGEEVLLMEGEGWEVVSAVLVEGLEALVKEEDAGGYKKVALDRLQPVHVEEEPAVDAGTHRATLGLGPDAGPQEIARAFRQLAKQLHPDKGGDSEQFRLVREAFEALSAVRQGPSQGASPLRDGAASCSAAQASAPRVLASSMASSPAKAPAQRVEGGSSFASATTCQGSPAPFEVRRKMATSPSSGTYSASPMVTPPLASGWSPALGVPLTPKASSPALQMPSAVSAKQEVKTPTALKAASPASTRTMPAGSPEEPRGKSVAKASAKKVERSTSATPKSKSKAAASKAASPPQGKSRAKASARKVERSPTPKAKAKAAGKAAETPKEAAKAKSRAKPRSKAAEPAIRPKRKAEPRAPRDLPKEKTPHPKRLATGQKRPRHAEVVPPHEHTVNGLLQLIWTFLF